MSSLNKVMLIGHAGKDPEIRYIGEGTPVCKFSLATSLRFKDRSGQQQERTEWHNIVVWGRQAEIANEYIRKGRQIFVEGRITTRSWTDAENVKKFMTEIVATHFVLLGRKDEASGPAPGGGGKSGSTSDDSTDYEDEELGPPLDYDDNILNPSA